MSKNKDKGQKYHFFAVGGNVVWRSEDGEQVHQVMTNSLIQLDSSLITQHALGMAQQGLMKSVMKKVGVEDPSVFVDVIILGLNYLGHMSEAHFYAVPEGMVRKQVEEAQAAAVIEEGESAASQPEPEAAPVVDISEARAKRDAEDQSERA